jgi:hypothetical protein
MQVEIQYEDRSLHLMERVEDGLADNAINFRRLMRLVVRWMIMLYEFDNALLFLRDLQVDMGKLEP